MTIGTFCLYNLTSHVVIYEALQHRHNIQLGVNKITIRLKPQLTQTAAGIHKFNSVHFTLVDWAGY